MFVQVATRQSDIAMGQVSLVYYRYHHLNDPIANPNWRHLRQVLHGRLFAGRLPGELAPRDGASPRDRILRDPHLPLRQVDMELPVDHTRRNCNFGDWNAAAEEDNHSGQLRLCS